MLIKYFKDIYTTKSEYPYTIYIYTLANVFAK